MEPLGFGLDAAFAAGLLDQRSQLGSGESSRLGRGRSCGQNGAGDRRAQSVPQRLGGGQEGWEVLAQVGAELVAGLCSIPDGVLLGPGQHGDGLDELGVFQQRAVGCGVREQDVRQDWPTDVAYTAALDLRGQDREIEVPCLPNETVGKVQVVTVERDIPNADLQPWPRLPCGPATPSSPAWSR